MAEEEAEVGAAMAITTYGHPLTEVSSFKSLVQVLLVSENVWQLVIWNLCRARQKWLWRSRVIGKEGADIGDFLYCGSSGSTYIWVGDVGNISADWEDAGKVSP